MNSAAQWFLAWGPWVALAGYVMGLSLAWLGRPRWAGPAALAGALGCAGAVAAIFWQQQRPPLFGGYESLLEMALLLGVLALVDGWRPRPGAPPAALSLGAASALLILLLVLPRSLSPDSFMYDYPWLRAFFQMRLLAQALLLHGALCFLGGWGQRGLAEGQPALLRGRWFLLAGWCAFMAGEFCGSLWSWRWMGDFWNWNAGFLESVALFLVIALPLHLPGRLATSRLWPSLSGLLAGLLTPLIMLVRQLWQV
ncbi:MAG: hypothetical protein V1806_07710 [Pseudomonadota bacterium]